jgi:hypothetical protein
VPTNSSRYLPREPILLGPLQNNSSRKKTSSGGAIVKTNTMSNENPFYDPARSYEQRQRTDSIVSHVLPMKSTAEIHKRLQLSDENPFHSNNTHYQYPAHIDPSIRIIDQATVIRPVDSKSLNFSNENPFYSNHGHEQRSSRMDTDRRTTGLPNVFAPLFANNYMSDVKPFSFYQPSTIREYSTGTVASVNRMSSKPFSTSIGDWVRNNPAPLSYRPIQVVRPFDEFRNRKDIPTEKLYVPPVSQSREPIVSTARLPTTRSNVTAPLEKTSLNMSPDNPFTQAFGRYHYPSVEEVKAKKRTYERANQHASVREKPITQTTIEPLTAYSPNENKDIVKGKAKSQYARFDIDI